MRRPARDLLLVLSRQGLRTAWAQTLPLGREVVTPAAPALALALALTGRLSVPMAPAQETALQPALCQGALHAQHGVALQGTSRAFEGYKMP